MWKRTIIFLAKKRLLHVKTVSEVRAFNSKEAELGSGLGLRLVRIIEIKINKDMNAFSKRKLECFVVYES